MSWRWFNASSPYRMIRVGNWYGMLRAWNLFNRHTKTGEHFWGFGILQIGQRHLFYVGYDSVSLLFMGKSK